MSVLSIRPGRDAGEEGECEDPVHVGGVCDTELCRSGQRYIPGSGVVVL